ncbi:hypothetical protein [Bradyrhizobium sp. CB3481]|uniref:hypothetical protein n=1 Tax=Bradyrhizobium sp. CB3481 TaxID=3039158 RepID=UPI0024B0A94F|nr:hypothetical protein [Bradyrhizobium sp. CB3481]WFU16458.1 hypothetical protein QA643_36890 [Bradyrhizobium sp. CB3481]
MADRHNSTHDRIAPGPEAKARIQTLGEKDFLTFFDELPVAGMQRVSRLLPKIHGFRPTSSLGISQQKAALARRLSRPNASDRDFHNLYLIWREWVDAKFKNAATVQELIDQVEDAPEGTLDEEARRLATETKVDALFAKLNEDSRLNLCTRELIERFMAFSPLPETAVSQKMISSSKAASDVERDLKFSDVPQRLQRTESELKETRASLEAATERIDQNARSLAHALSEIRELRTTTTQSRQEIDRIRADFQQQMGELTRLRDSVSAKDKTTETRLKTQSDSVEELRTRFSSFEAQVPDMSRTQETLAKFSVVMVDASAREQTLSASVTRIQSELELLTRDLITLSEDRTLSDKIVAIATRVTDLEAKPGAGATGTADQAPGHVQFGRGGTSSRLQWDSLSDPKEACKNLEAISQIGLAFSEALQAVGLRKSAAEVFGEECAASFAARQALFFKGSFAGYVARGLARSIGGHSVARISLPVGLDSDIELRAAINSAFQNGAGIGAIVLDGVDLVPLPIIREAVLDCLTARQKVLADRRIAVFGTFAGGVASLPIERSQFELGPVFDLDLLDWRTGYTGEFAVESGMVSAAADAAIWSELAKQSADIEEASRLARRFVNRREPAVERAILNAFRALSLARKRTGVTPVQSLFYGWLLPYWHALGVTKDQVDEEVDSGKDGSAVDPRLAAVLSIDFSQDGGRL